MDIENDNESVGSNDQRSLQEKTLEKAERKKANRHKVSYKKFNSNFTTKNGPRAVGKQ